MGRGRSTPTFQILCRENNRTEVIVLDQTLDLGGYLRAIPAHDHHLADRPAPIQRTACTSASIQRENAQEYSVETMYIKPPPEDITKRHVYLHFTRQEGSHTNRGYAIVGPSRWSQKWQPLWFEQDGRRGIYFAAAIVTVRLAVHSAVEVKVRPSRWPALSYKSG